MTDAMRTDDDARLRSFIRRCYPTAPITDSAIRRDSAPARVTGPRGQMLDAVRRALHAKTGQRVQLHVRSPQSDKEAVFIVAAPYFAVP